jgi:hypothetical protein
MVWGGKKSTSADTNSFPVYERLPSIGGIGPTSSFSLRSLKHNFAQKNSLRAKKKETNKYWSELLYFNSTHRTARACIRPITSGILPDSLFP